MNEVPPIICPFWPAPDNVCAGVSTIEGGVSKGNYTSFNLATHVGDSIDNVYENRSRLNQAVSTYYRLKNPKTNWKWLTQTHSSIVYEIGKENNPNHFPEADASITSEKEQVCVILTADCLPILLCDSTGQLIAAIHAGWRGLADNIIEKTAASLFQRKKDAIIFAWLGPAIGPQKFEVGEDVYSVFCRSEENKSPADSKVKKEKHEMKNAFIKSKNDINKYYADIYQIATLKLNHAGIHHIYGGGYCTHTQNQLFYSYRRQKITGRFASFIFLKP